MKFAYAHFCRIILALCLTWYSPIAMAGTGYANGMLTMEICANGVAETVRVDIGGAPADAPNECCECMGCGLVAANEPPMPGAAQILRTYDMPLSANLSGTSLTRISNIRPMPRAPPLARIAKLTIQDVITFDHSGPGQYMHSNGRPLSKDADA